MRRRCGSLGTPRNIFAMAIEVLGKDLVSEVTPAGVMDIGIRVVVVDMSTGARLVMIK